MVWKLFVRWHAAKMPYFLHGDWRDYTLYNLRKFQYLQIIAFKNNWKAVHIFSYPVVHLKKSCDDYFDSPPNDWLKMIWNPGIPGRPEKQVTAVTKK